VLRVDCNYSNWHLRCSSDISNISGHLDIEYLVRMAAGAVRLISNCSGPINAFPDAKMNNSKKQRMMQLEGDSPKFEP
jgi:hypothetical protein